MVFNVNTEQPLHCELFKFYLINSIHMWYNNFFAVINLCLYKSLHKAMTFLGIKTSRDNNFHRNEAFLGRA